MPDCLVLTLEFLLKLLDVAQIRFERVLRRRELVQTLLLVQLWKKSFRVRMSKTAK